MGVTGQGLEPLTLVLDRGIATKRGFEPGTSRLDNAVLTECRIEPPTSWLDTGVSGRASNWWGVFQAKDLVTGLRNASLARSAMVSVHAQEFGGDEVQPIGIVSGIPTKGGSPG